jgi:hypothetical protein
MRNYTLADALRVAPTPDALIQIKRFPICRYNGVPRSLMQIKRAHHFEHNSQRHPFTCNGKPWINLFAAAEYCYVARF